MRNKKNLGFSFGKVVSHPAFYDSGGMASAEAMVFGLPCVGFKLKAFDLIEENWFWDKRAEEILNAILKK